MNVLLGTFFFFLLHKNTRENRRGAESPVGQQERRNRLTTRGGELVGGSAQRSAAICFAGTFVCEHVVD